MVLKPAPLSNNHKVLSMTDHIMPSELQHPADRVTNDRTSKVSHVHLLRNVGTREVHHHALGIGNPNGLSKRGSEIIRNTFFMPFCFKRFFIKTSIHKATTSRQWKTVMSKRRYREAPCFDALATKWRTLAAFFHSQLLSISTYICSYT